MDEKLEIKYVLIFLISTVLALTTTRIVFIQSRIGWAKIPKDQNVESIEIPHNGFRSWGWDAEKKQGYMALNFPSTMVSPSIRIFEKNGELVIEK